MARKMKTRVTLKERPGNQSSIVNEPVSRVISSENCIEFSRRKGCLSNEDNATFIATRSRAFHAGCGNVPPTSFGAHETDGDLPRRAGNSTD